MAGAAVIAGASSATASAARDALGGQTLLLPEHYELMENGVVVFKLETGENLSLTAGQCLIFEDGLLLVTDAMAQASISSLPVMGAVRAQLLSTLKPSPPLMVPLPRLRRLRPAQLQKGQHHACPNRLTCKPTRSGRPVMTHLATLVKRLPSACLSPLVPWRCWVCS